MKFPSAIRCLALVVPLCCAVPVVHAANAADPQAPPVATTTESRLPATNADRILMMLAVPPAHYRPDQAYGGGYMAPGRAERRKLASSIAREHGMALVEGWPMPALGVDCFVLEVKDPADREHALAVLRADARVESAEPVQQFRSLAQATGPDPLEAVQPAARDWQLSQLHRRATGRGVLVAVLDSGVDARHPDLAGQDIATRNFVDGSTFAPERHGTAVAGIIAARQNNGVGIVGVSPGASLLGLRTCTEAAPSHAATCDTFSLAKGLQFALDARAQIVNLSLTGPYDRLIARLLDASAARNVMVVGAMDAAAADGGFPANHPGVIAVGGLRTATPPGMRDVARVPDRGIPAPEQGGGWDLVSGTSFAAAQVTGLAALLRQMAPRATRAQLQSVLLAPPRVGLRGALPAVDACTSVARLLDSCACDCVPPASVR